MFGQGDHVNEFEPRVLGTKIAFSQRIRWLMNYLLPESLDMTQTTKRAIVGDKLIFVELDESLITMWHGWVPSAT